jgi:hypothetical protein
MRGYVRRGSRLDPGEVISLVVLAVIGVWGVWFGVQSVLSLWWPLNALYLLAGLIVAGISTAVGRAILAR